MKREFKLTEDGSHTLYVEGLNEHYHSIHGALAESMHIFIEAGFKKCKKQEIRVLEFGFGTGLNALLTCIEAKMVQHRVYYHAIEKYPLTPEEVLKLNYDSLLETPGLSIRHLHATPWEKEVEISPWFALLKEQSDFRNIKAVGLFDVIYFDAFAPGVQPELWSREIFEKIFRLTATDGILITYSCKGEVKRNMLASGYKVEKIPGPHGKREILRALKED